MFNQTSCNQNTSNLPISQAVIYESELNYMARCIQDYPDLETGGDLFGFWTYSGFPVVQYVLGPGPNARHEKYAFYQDKNYLIESGQIIRDLHGLQHIGEWHSHHRLALAHPSGGDIATVRRAIHDVKLPQFFLVIGNIIHNPSIWLPMPWLHSEQVTLNGFLFPEDAPENNAFNPTGWVVLPGQSPMRQPINRHPQFKPHKPSTRKVFWTAEPRMKLGVVGTRPETASFHSGSWLDQPNGKTLLREIHQAITADFTNIQMFRENNHLSISFQHEKWSFSVDFPHQFPQEAPTLKFQAPDEETWTTTKPINPPDSHNTPLAFLTLCHQITTAIDDKTQHETPALYPEPATTKCNELSATQDSTVLTYESKPPHTTQDTP